MGEWAVFTDLPAAPSVVDIVLIDSSELDLKDDKLTILRTVGQVFVIPVQGGGALVGGAIQYWAGLRVCEVNAADAILELDPAQFTNADAAGPHGWMHLQYDWVSPPQVDSTPVFDGSGTLQTYHRGSGGVRGAWDWDVTTKRKMTGRENYLLTVSVAPNTITRDPGQDYQIGVWLRVLVKLG